MSPPPSERFTVTCPYCGAEKQVETQPGYSVLYVHPPNFIDPTGACKPTRRFGVVWSHFNYGEIPTNETIEYCDACGGKFHCESDRGDFEESPGYGNQPTRKYYIRRLQGNQEKIPVKPVLEKLLDRFCDRLHIGYLPGSLLFISIPFGILYILPIAVSGGLSKLMHDANLLLLVSLLILLLIFLKRHMILLRESFNFRHREDPPAGTRSAKPYVQRSRATTNRLPIFLGARYCESTWCRVLEELTFTNNIFGHPYKPSPGTIMGLILAGLFLAWQVLVSLNLPRTLAEGAFTGYPILYTSALVQIGGTAFGCIAFFIIGNTLWIYMATTAFIGLMTRYMPVEINPLRPMGGTDGFGRLMLSSIIPVTVIGAGIPLVIWQVMSSASQIFRVSPVYLLAFCVGLVFLFMLLIAFGFFYPLVPIHRLLKEEKARAMDRILTEITRAQDHQADPDALPPLDRYLLFRSYDKVQAMHEWPFRIETTVKVVTSVLIPFASLLFSITGRLGM